MAASKASTSDRPAPRIAIVDDDPAHLQVVKIILTRESLAADLHLFDDPLQAVAYLAAEPVNLILLDIGMAKMSGFEVASRVRLPGPNQATPIIFLTAFKETESILQAFEMGAADVLGKPLISPILIARIRAILDTQDLQRQLRQRNEALEMSNRLKDEMVSICSHDLRSPLSAIDLICQFLTDALEGRSKHQAPVLVNRIVNQSRLARRLVDNLLDLNRIEEGKLVPTPSFFRLRDLLATCTEDEIPLLQARSVKLVSHPPPEDLICFADREMIAQVVRNVLGNAIKFTRSVVTLDTRLIAAADDAENQIEICVADDGLGVPSEDLPTIFDKYRKSDQRGLGSGLGLFISRRMVELHHGHIEADSEPGRGARFTVTLPHAFPATALPDLSGFTEGRVLVISTSKPNALLLEGVLIEAGLVHVTKEWTTEPQEILVLPHIVVVDAQAPHGDLLAQVRARFREQGEHAAWIVVGSEAESAPLTPWLDGPPVRLPLPLNPLHYLRCVERLLAGSTAAGGEPDLSPARAARG